MRVMISYPGYDKVARDVLHISLDLRRYVQLVTVQGDPLEIRDQIFFRVRFRALVRNRASQFVQPRSVFTDFLRGINYVHRCFEWTFATREIRHLHHDHAHLLGDHDDIVALIVPFGDFTIEAILFRTEGLNLCSDLGFFLLRNQPIRVSGIGDAADIWIFVDIVRRRFAARFVRVIFVLDFRFGVEFFGTLRFKSIFKLDINHCYCAIYICGR